MMKFLEITSHISLSFFLAIPLFAAQTSAEIAPDSEGWILEKSEASVKISIKTVSDSSIKAFKAETTINASLASVYSVLEDVKTCSSWVKYCVAGKTIKEIAFGESINYLLSDLPWPGRNRDYIIHSRTQFHHNHKEIIITATGKPDLLETIKNTGRVQRVDAQYYLRQIEPGKTHIVWTQHADPAGDLPQIMVNSMLMDIPFYSLLNLKKIVHSKPYSSASFTVDSQNKITGITFVE